MGGWDEDSYRDLIQVRQAAGGSWRGRQPWEGTLLAAPLAWSAAVGGRSARSGCGAPGLLRVVKRANYRNCLSKVLFAAALPWQDQDDEGLEDMDDFDDFDSPAADY